jgi:hypothetical protein
MATRETQGTPGTAEATEAGAEAGPTTEEVAGAIEAKTTA